MTAEPRLVHGPDDLAAACERLASELSAAYDDDLVLVAVLKGSVPFLADLVRRMAIHVAVDFLAISSYAGSSGSGRVRLLQDLSIDIHDRDVVIVEEIVDTGLTANYLLGELRRRGPRSVEVCALLDRAVRRIVPVPLRFTGFVADDAFVIGYGMDFQGRYRNLDRVLAADLAALGDNPDAHVAAVYGG